MKTYHQSQELTQSNPLAFPAKLYDAYFGNKRQQLPLHAVENGKMAGAGEG